MWPQYAVLAAFAALVAAYLIWTMRDRRRNFGKWIIALTLLAGATAFALRVPDLDVDIDRTAGVPNLSALLCAIAYTGVAGLMHVWIAGWTSTQKRRHTIIAAVCTVAVVLVLATLFAVGRHPTEHPVTFSIVFLNPPTIALSVVYMVTFACAWPLAALSCHSALRAMARADQEWDPEMRRLYGEGDQWLAYGLRLVCSAMWCTFAYALLDGSLFVVALLHIAAARPWLASTGNAAALAAASQTTVGSTCGVWGPGLSARRAPHRAARAEARDREIAAAFAALWQRIRDQVASNPAPYGLDSSASAAAVYGSVQLADACRELSDYADARICTAALRRARALGYSPGQARALAEAALLLGAAAARRAGRAPAEPTPLRQVDPRADHGYLLAVAGAAGRVDDDGVLLDDRFVAERLARRVMWLAPVRRVHPRVVTREMLPAAHQQAVTAVKESSR